MKHKAENEILCKKTCKNKHLSIEKNPLCGKINYYGQK